MNRKEKFEINMKCFGALLSGFILIGLSNSNVIPSEEDFKSNENGKNTDTLLLAHIVSTVQQFPKMIFRCITQE